MAMRPMTRHCAVMAVALSMAWAGYPESDEDQIRKLLGEMTTEEKFHQTCIDNECPEHRARWLKCDPAGGGGTAGGGDGWFNLKDISRLNIRGMRMRDGPKGMTCQGGNGPFSPPCPEDGGSPSFPSQITRAATWNVELEESIGRAIGIVASKLDVHAALLPTINILPWLNWGRAQESYGEDPFFSGKMGAAVVNGVQHDQKVMATAKHFLANNIENTRWWVSAEMDEQTLHDVYLRAWALVVADSSPELIMTSYNRAQGKWAFTDPKFINILRNDLGFDGSIMTDWFASWEAITGGMILGEIGKSSPFYGSKGFIPSNSLYNAGIDMEMPMCSKNRDAICQAQTCAGDVEEDCTTLKHLDRVTDRILRSKQRYGLLAAMRNHTQRITWDNSDFDRLILEAAQEGIVLLKNEDLLPKTQASVSRLAVLGSAEQLELGDHGSSAVKPSGRMVNVLEGLKEKYSDAEVIMINNDLSSPDVAAFVKSCDLVVIDVGLNFTFEGEFIPPQTGGDRMYLTLHPQEEELIKQASKLSSKVVVAITSGASIIVENFVNEVQAILWMGYPGPLGGLALANILSGEVNPSGRMPSVTPKKAEDYLPKGISAAPWALETVDVTPTYPYSHGFKHMWQNGIAPRYPFGFGLSYTSYSYSELSTAAAGSTVEVTVQVTNQGERAGLETVQVYATCKDCRKRRLPIMLVAFKKVKIEAAETKDVQLTVQLKDLAAYQGDGSSHFFLLEGGVYEFLVGPCLGEAVLRSSMTLDEQTFRYPGKARRENFAPVFEAQKECPSFKCVPEAEHLLLKGWQLPDKSPLDLLLAVSIARKHAAISVTCLAVVAFGLLLGLGCCCRRCCRCCRKSEVSEKKKQ